MKNILNSLFLVVLSISMVSMATAQTSWQPTAGATETFNVTNGDTFYDHGGPGGDCEGSVPTQGNYLDCECTTVTTLTSETALTINFNEFKVFGDFDWLKIYEGTNTSGTLLYNSLEDGDDLAGMLDSKGASFTSQGGSITFEFYATSIVGSCGWDVAIASSSGACELTCVEPITVDNDPGECGAYVEVAAPEFNEDCATFVTYINEDFEAASGQSAAGWSVEMLSGDIGDVFYNFEGAGCDGFWTPQDGGQSGNFFIVDDDCAGSGAGAYEVCLVSDAVDLSATTSPNLDYNYTFRGPVGVHVDYSEDGSTWNELFSTTLSSAGALSHAVPSSSATTSVRFCFDETAAGWNWGAGFDNIVLSGVEAGGSVSNNSPYADSNDGAADGWYPVGTTTVTFTSADAEGAVVTCTVDVTVEDTEGPTMDCPSDMFINLDAGECEQVVTYVVDATDNCGFPSPNNSLVMEPFSGYNNIGQAGVMFDVTNETDEDLNITGFDLTMRPGTWDYQVYYTTGTTYNGVETAGAFGASNADWNFVGQVTVTSTGYNEQVNIDMPFFIPPGCTGIYLTSTISIAGGPSVTGNQNVGGGPYTDGTLTAYNHLLWHVVGGVWNGGSFGASSGSDCATSTSYYNLHGAINWAPSGGNVYQLDDSGYTSGDAFPIGTTCQEWGSTDVNGLESTCEFCITVAEYANPIDDLACNDLVNLTLDGEDCEATLTADMFLEGGPYGCYDDYIVTPATVDGSMVGTTIEVMVQDPETGVTCWGYLLIEDKTDPTIECEVEAIEIACTSSLEPVEDYPTGTQSGSWSGNLPYGTGSPNPPGDDLVSIDVDVANVPAEATIANVTVDVKLTHTWLGDVVIDLIAPDGTRINLIDGQCGGNDDMDATFDDNGNAVGCGNVPPSISGTVRPADALANVFASNPNGTWTIEFEDNFPVLDNGYIEAVAVNVDWEIVLPQFPETFDACGDVELEYTDVIVDNGCSGDYAAVVTRTWTATDASGNSSSCTQTINVLRATLGTIVYPLDYDGIANDAFECNGDWVADATGAPAAIPVAEGGAGVPGGGSACGTIVATYEDLRIDICPGTFKVLRKWTVVDWCTGLSADHTQYIKVEDSSAPQLTCPPDMTVAADYETCGAQVVLPAPTIYDDCSGAGSSYSVEVSEGSVYWDGAYYILVVPAEYANCDNAVIVTYTGADGCGNEASCEMKVTVRDEVPPVPVADVNTTISLSLGGNAQYPGYAEIQWSTFDDGSYDNCGIKEIQVKRANDACGVNDAFRDYVSFCCDDIGTTVVVELGVWDNCNNFNSAFINVTVEEGLIPTAVAPENITISCSYPLDIWDLSAFGTVETDADDIDSIFIDDEEYYDCLYPNGYFGDRDPIFWTMDGYASSTCGVTVTETVTPTLECGQGTVRRVFEATSAGGKKKKVIQYITVTDCNPFGWDDINWPKDVNSTACMDPNAAPLDYPSYDNEDNCSLVSETYEDQLFTFTSDSACWKILRTWTVIDWCQYNPDNGENYGKWTHTQVIKQLGTVAPTFDPCEDVVQCTDDVDGCSGRAELIAPVSDDCTETDNLIVEYWIDAFNDGAPGLNGYDISGTGLDASGYYPFGTHRILWRAEDLCGNSETCEYLFTVVDCKKPSPVCYNGLSTVVMPSGDTSITVWASDFDASSFDNCGELELRLIKSEDNPNTEVPADWFETFTCADVTGFGTPVQLWVGDAGYDWNGNGTIEDEERNWDYCETYIIVQDPNGVCGNSGTGAIAGTVQTEITDMIQDATITVSSNHPGFPAVQVTSNDGVFAFNGVPVYHDYSIIPERNDDHKNGVTTYDLVLMQKHILGIESLNSNYKVLAADANADNKVTAIDIVEFRKLILGYYNELPNNTAWKFVDENYDWSNGVWNAPTQIDYNNLSSAMMNTDFVGVKVGDVNESANANDLLITEDRSEGTLVLNADNQTVAAGQTIAIDVTAANFNKVMGYQFTMNMEGLEFVSVTSGAIEIAEDNFGTAMMDDGFLTTSWNNIEGVTVAEGEVLFTMNFKAQRDGQLKDMVSVGSAITPAEAYSTDAELMNVAMNFQVDGNVATADFALYQNTPNPFNNSTVIGFTMPAASNATLTVFDVTGKAIYTVEGEYTKGYNTVEILRNQLSATGVLYYQLDTEDYTATKKMIVID